MASIEKEVLDIFIECFTSKAWDPLCCSKDDIRERFREWESSSSRHIDHASFNVLYRRAACEALTLGWKATRKAEKAREHPESPPNHGDEDDESLEGLLLLSRVAACLCLCFITVY